MIVYGLLTLGSYLLGAVPFGFLLVRWLRGVDLRTVGSGNLGATNAARILGTSWFAVVFLFDFLKGFVPAFVVGGLAHRHLDAPETIGLLYGFAAMVGHIWPVYLKFRGGKGVATAAGAVMGIAPPAAGVAAAVFAVVFFSWRYVSLGSIAAAVSLPAAHAVIEGKDAVGPILGALVAIAALVVFKHRSNIGRLLRGVEPKAVKKDQSRAKEAGDDGDD